MNASADLELALHRRDGSAYSLEMRFSDPSSEVDRAQHRGSASRPKSCASGPDAAAYGATLGGQLLADAGGRSFFDQAVAVSQSQGQPLRIRLAIGPGSRAAQPALGDAAPARRRCAAADRRDAALLPLPEQPGLAAGPICAPRASCERWSSLPTPATWRAIAWPSVMRQRRRRRRAPAWARSSTDAGHPGPGDAGKHRRGVCATATTSSTWWLTAAGGRRAVALPGAGGWRH